MFFKFINYISPTWYFNLEPFNNTIPYKVDVNLLPDEEKSILTIDSNYSTETISKLDAGYQAWHKGLIKTDLKYNHTTINSKPDLIDEYYFIRKYYKSFWAVYILFIRLFSLHNPFKEVYAFHKTRNTRRVDLYRTVFDYIGYNNYESALLQQNPLVSIIIPTLNRYIYLEAVLNDLENQVYRNFEVIIIDQSEPFKESLYKNRNFKIEVIHQKAEALWQARNTGIKTAKGEYLLFYDDDSRIEKDWITHHIKTMDFFEADISSGVSISVIGAEVPINYSFFRWSDQIDTGNFMIKRDVFKTTGLFDRQFEGQRMGDGEFGIRCYLNGFKNISNPHARRIHLKVGEGGLRQMGSWDAFRPNKLFSPRPIPSVNYFIRKYFGTKNAVLNLIISLPPSVMPYRFKGSKKLMVLGYFLFIVFLPVFLIPVLKAWRISSIMLSEKEKIEFI